MKKSILAAALVAVSLAINSGASQDIRLMSYNILHGKGADGKVDIARIAAVINRERPDFVGLQEVD